MKLHLNYQVMNTHKNLRNHKTSEASKSTNQKSNLKLTWKYKLKTRWYHTLYITVIRKNKSLMTHYFHWAPLYPGVSSATE